MLSAPTESSRGLGLRRNASRACMLADTLSWAVRRGIPVKKALLTVPFYRNPRHCPTPVLRGLLWLLSPCLLFLPVPWLLDIRWSIRLERVGRDLDAGYSLSDAFHRRLRRRFPRFYLVGMARAEAEGRLETALPVLAYQLNYPCEVADARRRELFFVLAKLIWVAAFVGFISTTLVPRVESIVGSYPDIRHAARFPLPLGLFSSVLGNAIWILFLFLFVVPRLGVVGEYILLYLPVVGRDLRRFAVGDAVRGMAAFVRQGDDIATAAEWSVHAAGSHWMRRRLKRFVRDVRNGVRWDEAWIRMNVGKPIDRWVIRNAAAREDPASGFELLAEWLHQETEMSTRRIQQFIDPIFTLGVAAIVGVVCVYTFSSLIQILYSLT